MARRAGVPLATAKHYLREGLFPKAKKTHRNMAYYAPAAVERIRLVKELQEKRFLPLRVIKTLVAGRGGGALRTTLSEAAERTLAGSGEALARERAARVAEVSADEIRALERAQVIARPAGGVAYGALDARLLAIVGDLRRAGFTRRRGFGAGILSIYKRAMDDLAEEEIAVFLSRVVERVPPGEAAPMMAAAIERVGELLAVLRRKALARRIAALTEATESL